MKANVAALLLTLTLLPTTAFSTTLEVTSGFVDQNSDDFGDWSYDLKGSNFRMFGTAVGGSFPGLTAVIFGGPISAPLEFGSVVVDGITYPGVPDQQFGSMTFFNGPVPPDEIHTPFLPGVPQMASTPFVMSGFANIGGTRYDLVGHGTLVETVCSGCGRLGTPADVRYGFSAPEPTPLLLIAVGIIGVAAAGCWSHRRSVTP
jgi:hypothetical protein